MSALQDLVTRWREEAELLRKRGCSAAAEQAESYAAELGSVLAAQDAEPLRIAKAAQVSGYSASQLRRLFPGQRTIPRADLPRKPRRNGGADDALVARRKGSS